MGMRAACLNHVLVAFELSTQHSVLSTRLKVFIMAAPSPCPSVSRLQRLLTGAPVAEEHTGLLEHLAACTICQEKLDKLAGADPAFLNTVTTSRFNVYAEEAPLRRVLDALDKDATATTVYQPHGQLEWWQSLLRPVGPLETPG